MPGEGTVSGDLPRLGSVFGHYRLDALVGRGGMGVVFRATDLRLERSVALKFLAPELAADEAFRERFIRESRLAAAIEHPAIVPVYEAGEAQGVLFIAMRYVPGRDLGSILRREAPIDAARTLAIARSLADALDAAHRRGLVHRDVKPGNVLVEQDGEERAYLADFGLTRRLGELTSQGRSGPLGTLDYVAPEQIAQRPLDGRADQYALACLVFHCLTGSPPFDGDTDAAVLYAHLHGDRPRPSQRDPALPATLDASVHRALSQEPDDRFPDCRSFVAALDASIAGPTATGAVPGARSPVASQADRPPGSPARRPPVLLAGGGVAAILGVLLAGGLLTPGDGLPDASGRAATDRPEAERARLPGVAPGEVIVFASDARGSYDLYALEAGRTEPRPLTRTAQRQERSPAISPDGQTIAYVAGTTGARDIWLMDADGRRPRRLTSHPADDIDPAWSADGRSLAFASSRAGFYDIYEIRDRGSGLDERNARNLTDRPALEHFPDWAPSGRRLVIASNHYGGNRDIFTIDATDESALLRRTATPAFDFHPSWSPDGRSIAFYRRSFCPTCSGTRGPSDLWVMGERGDRARRLTNTPGRDELDPDWSPDGRALVYSAGQPGTMEIFLIEPNGGSPRQLTRGWADAVEPTWGVVAASPAPSTTVLPAER